MKLTLIFMAVVAVAAPAIELTNAKRGLSANVGISLGAAAAEAAAAAAASG